MTTQFLNSVLLEGIPVHAPEWSHENHDTQFYRFFLEIPRLSGQTDLLPILLPESLISLVHPGQPLRLDGEFRSFNNRSGNGSRLVLTVYARHLQEGHGEMTNHIALCGTLCKPPIFRHTPLGRSISDLMLAVPRRYGRTDYLPVIAWGQLALRTSCLQVGDSISLEGRVQSRCYRKTTPDGIQDRVAYEVSMMHLLDEDCDPSAELSP